MTEMTIALIEQACEVMHDAYENAAVIAGWETQQQSRKPWADVPEENKATMRVAVGALFDWLQADIEQVHAEASEYRRAVEALSNARDGAPLSTTLAWLIEQGYLVPAEGTVLPR